ncbi:MAG: tripartite tricarboxylate transporter TctB family protein [Pseudomonadota bacterium]
MSESAAPRRSIAEAVLSVGVLLLGIATAVGTSMLPSEGGYARIGPNVMPGVAATGLILLGIWLLYEVASGGWRTMPPQDAEARGEHVFHRAAFVWVSIGLFAHMALIDTGGFVLAGATLFACVARGFGSPRFARDLAIGFIMALAVFMFFVLLLTVSLPAGWLAPLFRLAGIE